MKYITVHTNNFESIVDLYLGGWKLWLLGFVRLTMCCNSMQYFYFFTPARYLDNGLMSESYFGKQCCACPKRNVDWQIYQKGYVCFFDANNTYMYSSFVYSIWKRYGKPYFVRSNPSTYPACTSNLNRN